jgi:hypothetical protein
MPFPTRREFIAASAAVISSTGSLYRASANDEKADIWGRAILAQPHDKVPFREIKIPAWVQDTTGVGYTLSVMNSPDRKVAADLGATISEVGFVDPFFAYYDSKLLKRRSPHVRLDRVEKDIAEYASLGVRILGVYPPTLQGEVYELHPDWRRIATDTTEIPQVDLKKYPHGGMLCLLGPYGDFFIDVLAEIVTKFPSVSAFSFDGLHHAGGCYCANCRANYKTDTGQAIPKRDMESEAFRKYQHWADRGLEDVIRRAQNKLKKINPDVALVTWTTNAGRFGHLLDIPRNMSARMNLLLDAPDQEFWMDETNRGASVVPAFGAAYVWAITNHRVAFAEPYLMSRGNPYGKDSFPAHEIERRVLLALTHGAGPSIAYAQPEQMKPGIATAMKEVKKRKPWLTHKSPEPWAAILVSDNTRVLYGRSAGQVEDRYLANVFGFFRTALEEHLPYTLVNDWNLVPEDLSKFKVLVLPNAASIDERQAETVRKFVEGGGGLVASLDASLCDEFGTPRKQIALADVLGIDHQGTAAAPKPGEKIDENFARTLPPDYWTKRKGVWDFQRVGGPDSFLESPRLTELIGRTKVTFKGPVVRVKPHAKSRVLATVQTKDNPKSVDLPALVASEYGRGRSVYLAAGLDAAYYLTSYPYQRLVLSQAIQWAANSMPPVQVKAPMCVHAVTVRQSKAGERLIVHLFNDVNTTTGHGHPAEEVPLREEVLPIHDIRVSFHGYSIQRVHLEPGETALEMRKTDDKVEVIVPKLSVHSMVVAELK